MLKLEKHKAFPWKKYQWRGISFYIRGWFEFQDQIYSEKCFEDFFEKIKEKPIEMFVQKMNGNFSLIKETEEQMILVCDRICSFPVFYGGETNRGSDASVR